MEYTGTDFFDTPFVLFRRSGKMSYRYYGRKGNFKR